MVTYMASPVADGDVVPSAPASRPNVGGTGAAAFDHAMRVPLVDAHAHALYHGPVDARLFAQAMFLTGLPDGDGEAGRSGDGASAALARLLDSRLGCELARLARTYDGGTVDPRGYWRTRGGRRYEDRLLRSCGVRTWIIDTGAAADLMETPDAFVAHATGGVDVRGDGTADDARTLHAADVVRVVRLESVAERVLRAGDDAASVFPERFRAALVQELRGSAGGGTDDVRVVGFKSVAAYRTGFAIDWNQPDETRVAEAVARLDVAGHVRLADPVVEAFIVNEALRYGLPIQFHVGFGDGDARVRDTDPTLLEPLAHAGAPLHLLHCVPYERQAAWMCAMHPNVHMDLSLAVMRAGVQGARALLERALQWCPFGRLLYASDGFGVAETHALGAFVWRKAIGGLARDWVSQGLWGEEQAMRVIDAIAHGNAERLYRLG